jgi:CDP-diacylglycerol--glycerol-3-phosphate 3-phosphatidyltransferase
MLNPPNLLTMLRIVLILPFGLLFFDGALQTRWAALAVFLVACATDWLDGHLARRLNQGSALGRMLDPIADKLLAATALVSLIATGAITRWSILAALAILLREFAVSGFREHLGQIGVVVPVSGLAKWKTTAQLVSLSLLIVPIDAVQPLGIALLWVAAALTLVTGWSYLRVTLRSVG